MGNAQSVPRHNLYITKVSNMDLPLCPFIHAIVGYNEMPVEGTDPLALRQVLESGDLLLEVLDVRDSARFKLRIPRGTERLGINVIKLASVPELMKMQVTAVRESSSTPLRAGDQILGIEGKYCDTEDEVIYHIKSGGSMRLIVLRDALAESIELTSTELGCEIGIGILYKVRSLDYHMKDYNGRIQREYSNKAKQQRLGGGHDSTATSIETEPGTHDGDKQTMDNGAADTSDKTQDPSVLSSGESMHPEAPCAGDSDGHQSGLDGKDATFHTSPGDAVQDENHTHDAQGQTLDRKNYDQIFSEAGLPKETEYFGGERMHDQEAVGILNQTLVSKEDFVESNGEQRMKDDTYIQRAEDAGSIRALFEEDDDDLPFESAARAEECQDL